jgi:hypothetical protein
MILISHRGNIDRCSERENSPDYIDEALGKGYYIELDVRKINDKLYLGHDSPQYETTLDWLLQRNQKLFIHTKNVDALNFLIDKNLKTFYHQNEDHVIINNCNLIWSNKLSEVRSLSVIPLLSREDIAQHYYYSNVYGICSDFIGFVG